MTNFAFGYTTVHDSDVLGRIIIDPSIPRNEIHLYRVIDGEVVVNKILSIADEGPECSTKTTSTQTPSP